MSQLEEQTVDVCAKYAGGEKPPWMCDLRCKWIKKKNFVSYLRVLVYSLLQPILPSRSARSAQAKMQSNVSFKTTVFGKWAGDM